MRRKLLLSSILTVLLSKPVCAVPVASDDASAIAYSTEVGGAWKGLEPDATENAPGMDNGGFGFLPWSFAGGIHNASLSPYGNRNHFIDGVDFAHSSYNDLDAPAFGLTNANLEFAGYTSRATRLFSQPLAVGGSFSVEFDNSLLASPGNNDETGYIIRFNSGGGAKIDSNPDVYERLGFFAYFGFNQGHWNRSDALGVHDSGLVSSATTPGAMFRVTLLATETFRLDILPLAGGSALYSATGSLASPGTGSIDTLEIVMFGNGSGNGLTGSSPFATGQREFFFNDLLLDNPQLFSTGDYNRNGLVDAADYTVWRNSLGRSVPNGDGADGNQDGVITQLDYNIWKLNFGASFSGASADMPSGIPGIPEPTTISIATFAALTLAVGCRRSSVGEPVTIESRNSSP